MLIHEYKGFLPKTGQITQRSSWVKTLTRRESPPNFTWISKGHQPPNAFCISIPTRHCLTQLLLNSRLQLSCMHTHIRYRLPLKYNRYLHFSKTKQKGKNQDTRKEWRFLHWTHQGNPGSGSVLDKTCSRWEAAVAQIRHAYLLAASTVAEQFVAPQPIPKARGEAARAAVGLAARHGRAGGGGGSTTGTACPTPSMSFVQPYYKAPHAPSSHKRLVILCLIKLSSLYQINKRNLYFEGIISLFRNTI